MNGLEPLIPVALFFSVASVIILRGPIGKAIADRISGRASRLKGTWMTRARCWVKSKT